jgi:hypothetical protein
MTAAQNLHSPASEKMPTASMPFTGAQFGLFAPAVDYAVDAVQRGVLFFDVMRERGNQYRDHLHEAAPNVLDFKVELVIDGRRLERPVNYGLVRVLPPVGSEIDSKRRPFVVVDPRAGHGPGIGGFKADSEIGVAFKAAIPATLSASCLSPWLGKRSRISPAQRRCSWKRSSRCIRRPTANPA